jgi:hypothetical protein
VTEITDPATGFPPTAIFSPTLADRQRDEIKVAGTWQPTDALLLQFSAAGGKDEYSAPTDYAVRDSRMDLYTIDASYALSEAWSINGFASYGRQKLNQARPAGAILDFDNTTTTVGIGATGRISETLEIGGSLAFIDDRNVYAQALDSTATPSNEALLAATGGLPDIKFQQAELRLFGRYVLDRNSAVRVDAVYQRTEYNDWSYEYAGVPYRFGDNTTVTIQQEQNVGYVGISYIYTWR